MFHDTATIESATRLTYTENPDPSAGQWTVASILQSNGQPEVIGRTVIDTGEHAVIVAELESSAWASAWNRMRLVTRQGTALSIDFTGANGCGFYLHNSPDAPSADTVSSTDLPANGTYPSQTTLFNYDTDRDSQAGLVLQTGGSGASESDATKYQNWQTGALEAGLEISGTVTLRLWAAMSGFSATSSGEVVAYLREFNGVGYSEIASSSLAAATWDSDATGGYVQRTIEFDQVSHTIATGNELEVKLIVGSSADSAM